jgi:cyclohexanecarboxyl-CoA dehydrogenase
MDFSFSAEQQATATALREFATRELRPQYAQADRTGQFAAGIWQRLGEMGLLGLRVPQAHGGQQFDCVTAGLAFEETARGDFNACYGMLLAAFAGELLGQHASPAIQAEWLPAVARGEKIVCVGLTEAQGGSDAAALRTRAVRQGDGSGAHYVLNGEKSSVTLVMAGDACIVFAKTDSGTGLDKSAGSGAGASGVSAFLVPLHSPGVSRQPYADMGSKAIVRGGLFLDSVRVPASHLIGPEHGAFGRVMQAFDYTRALIGLMCIGTAMLTLEETITYTKERQAFGQPISKNQGVSFPIAEWHAQLTMARWHCYRTLWLRDQGQPHSSEAASCKGLVPQLCVDAIQGCLVLHGHYGYTQDFPIEQRLRDVTGQLIADGTPQIQKLIIARGLFGRDFV